MRPAFRRGWEGEGKLNRCPWRGPADAKRPPHGGNYSASGNERAKPLAFPPIRKRGRSGSLSRNAAQERHPRNGETQTSGVAASETGTRPLSQRVSAASPRESSPVARPARKEARVPAGQPNYSAPSRSAVGKSAALTVPAHYHALLIVTCMGRDNRPGSRSE
jgi:hypothetical protein